MLIRTTSEWVSHCKKCIPEHTPVQLLDELFDQTGESLDGEMAMWKCGRCPATAFLMVRNLPSSCERCVDYDQTGDYIHAVVDVDHPKLVAVFTPHVEHDDHLGKHSACRILF